MFQKKDFFSLIILALLLNSCICNHYVKSDSLFYKTENLNETDSAVVKTISPYKSKLDEEMNKVIGYCDVMLAKEQPESNMGNWAADAVADRAGFYAKKEVSFALLNYGGLRIESIAPGPITKSKIFELMPFDNMLVVIEVQGNELDKVFRHAVAKGGWPVSSAVKLTADASGKLIKVLINGEPVDADKTYNIATIDYLASGGDNCDFFKNKKQFATGIFLRNAIIEHVENMNAEGMKINVRKEGRFVFEK